MNLLMLKLLVMGQKILLLVDAGISMLIVIWGGFIILKIADFLVV